MAEYVTSVSEVYEHYTTPAHPEADCQIQCFQLLRKKTRDVLVRTTHKDRRAHERWLVQPLQMWRGADYTLGQDRFTKAQNTFKNVSS